MEWSVPHTGIPGRGISACAGVGVVTPMPGVGSSQVCEVDDEIKD